MAMHTIVVDSSTVIGCNVTAEIAFILDVVLLVLFTIGDTEFVICFLTEEFAFWALEVVKIESETYPSSNTKIICLCLLTLLSL
jgi:ABC-type uncharacterized transport system permease subunit